MPGFFSWIKGRFSQTPPRPPDSAPRLLNPNSIPEENEPKDTGAEVSIRQLEECLFCWLLDTTPRDLNETLSASSLLILDKLEQKVRRQSLDELPRQPMTLPMLSRCLSDDNADRKELTRIILSDPALTDQLLHVANSPSFRPGEKSIESVDQAVFMLGMNGIRNVISAAIMRPMMGARNSREALFAQRVWRWGLTCAKAAELVGRLGEKNDSNYFMTGLLPALAYMTLRRELIGICKTTAPTTEPPANLVHQALSQYQWATAQILATTWKLSPDYHARLLAAERPAPDHSPSPLTDGIIIGTREILRHAHQKNMAEEDLLKLVQIAPEQFTRIRRIILDSIEADSRGRA